MNSNSAGRQAWHAIPWDVAGRIGLLFLTLCGLKLVMLAGFREHLFEVHWRIGSDDQGWVNVAAFYLLAVLAGLNLWQFARRCSSGGARTVRAANAVVLLAGACFILLTLCAHDSNYLDPVMKGTLSWLDLRWYLNLVLFFQWPFLAVWIFIYAASYYVLARTKRGHLVLYLTAIFAAAYIATSMRDLMTFRKALLAADALGIACVLAGTGVAGAAGWLCVIQPWFWAGFFALLLHLQDPLLLTGDPEVSTLCGWSIVLFAGLSVFAWRRKFAGAWLWLLPFAFTSFVLLVNIHYSAADNYRNLFFGGLTLPRYFLGEFAIASGLLVAATVYRRWLPTASLLWLDIIGLLLIALTLADLRLSQIMGIRLDWQAVQFGSDPKMVWRLAKPYLPELAGGLIMLAALYAVFVGLWKRETARNAVQIGRDGGFVIIAFLLLGAAGIHFASTDKAEGQTAILLAETSPVFSKTINAQMDSAAFMRTTGQLGMSQLTRSAAPGPVHAPRNLNVVVIFQESCYNKYLSLFDGTEDTEPELSKYKDRMELFPNFFSNFAASMNARFAAYAGLYPTPQVEPFTYHRVNVESLFDILHQNGYSCSVFYSSYFDYTGFRDFLRGRGIDTMFDADTMPGVTGPPPLSWGLSEGQTLKAIQSQIRQYSTNHQKFFLSYVPVAPHNPFDGTPREFKKYSLKIPGDFTPKYLNEVLYEDSIIGSIIGELKDCGLLDNTLVVVTDDHGEMLGENGGPVGHGWFITPELANIPLIIMDPGNPGYHVNDTIGSQVDLLPTVLDLLGIPLPPGQLCQGDSLYSAAAQAGRTIYINSLLQYGIIKGRRFICGTRETGNSAADAADDKTFAIVNNGARTVFLKTNSVTATLPPISEFDKFQENLLQNYSYYCQLIK
jgi:phosphoglycerol transferase MdoB-like AlkP superfamily enzyme